MLLIFLVNLSGNSIFDVFNNLVTTLSKMRTVNIGDLKTNFSQILKDVENGEKIIIAFGKQSKKLAVIVPFQQYFGQRRKLGLLAKRGKVKFTKDWAMSEEELIAQ